MNALQSNTNWSNRLSLLKEQFIYLIAFSLPFKFPVPILILITFCLSVTRSLIQKDFLLKRSVYFYLLLFLSILPVIYLPFTLNFQEGLTAIEVKLSYLALPVIFFFSELKLSFFKVFKFFLIGNLVAIAACFSRALLRFNELGAEAFYYENFSFFMHPSYFAMYINLSIFSLFYFYFGYRKISRVLFFISLFVLAITPAFLASKMGVLALFIALPVFILSMLWKRNRKIALGILGIAAVISFILVNFIPGISDRFQTLGSTLSHPESIDKSTLESNAVRLLVWDAAVEVWKENFILGATPGDANDVLYSKYEEKNYSGALSHHLNAHNQYLQTALGMGIIGLLHLLALFIVPLFDEEIRSPLFFGFTALLFFNFLVESMLQTQAGVTFHAFFLCLFLCGKTRLGNTVLKS